MSGIYKIGQKVTIYQILSYDGSTISKDCRGNRQTNHTYSVMCTKCGTVKQITQRTLKGLENDPPFYCLGCPPNIRREGLKLKKARNEQRRLKIGELSAKDNHLFRLAIFKELA